MVLVVGVLGFRWCVVGRYGCGEWECGCVGVVFGGLGCVFVEVKY